VNVAGAANVAPDAGDVNDTCGGWLPGTGLDPPPDPPDIEALVKYPVEYATVEWLVNANPT
jgi:hypothetical protein